MENQTDDVFLKIPGSSWELMKETLQTDARSNNFDRTLRVDIKHALESVEEFQPNKANLFKHLPNGFEVTERVLYTLNKHWEVRTMHKLPMAWLLSSIRIRLKSLSSRMSGTTCAITVEK
jgi:hypothetical protein